jgi:hypothetical protein
LKVENRAEAFAVKTQPPTVSRRKTDNCSLAIFDGLGPNPPQIGLVDRAVTLPLQGLANRFCQPTHKGNNQIYKTAGGWSNEIYIKHKELFT